DDPTWSRPISSSHHSACKPYALPESRTMLKNLPLTLKLFLAPTVAVLGLILYVGYTSLQLSATDSRLQALETRSYPVLERADAAIFQFSRIPGLLNSAVAAGEQNLLTEAGEVLQAINTHQQELEKLIQVPNRRQQLNEWRLAVDRYADNAISVSGKLVSGSASFGDLRPSLDRMANDLAQAQTLAAEFRSAAYEDFEQTLAETREVNATTTRLGIILSLALLILRSEERRVGREGNRRRVR